jgi:hypothetical protein
MRRRSGGRPRRKRTAAPGKARRTRRHGRRANRSASAAAWLSPSPHPWWSGSWWRSVSGTGSPERSCPGLRLRVPGIGVIECWRDGRIATHLLPGQARRPCRAEFRRRMVDLVRAGGDFEEPAREFEPTSSGLSSQKPRPRRGLLTSAPAGMVDPPLGGSWFTRETRAMPTGSAVDECVPGRSRLP